MEHVDTVDLVHDAIMGFPEHADVITTSKAALVGGFLLSKLIQLLTAHYAKIHDHQQHQEFK